MQLTNPGSLTTTFEIHFPNERDIEVPQWADEGEPNEGQLRENRIIDELKSFEIYPRKGTLKSGESVAVTFAYKYNSLDYGGLHELGVHMKINQGKQFRVLLQGETLSGTACRLWQSLPPSDGTHRLMPVAIGTTLELAPLQTSELMNTGESDLHYEVDTRPLAPGGRVRLALRGGHPTSGAWGDSEQLRVPELVPGEPERGDSSPLDPLLALALPAPGGEGVRLRAPAVLPRGRGGETA